MKHLILLVAIMGFTITLNAQSQKQIDKAKSCSEYIAKAMSLDEAKTTFLYKALLNNAVEAKERKKGLDKEAKKAVNKALKNELKAELSKQFSKEEIKRIFALMKEKRALDKKK
ncbi:MAG: hypothetical protein DSY76_02500 [Bacteroidetes bacterium]|nr:MAG: hypothetical protein DSY76_02500 [Bacteroidota bacterium]